MKSKPRRIHNRRGKRLNYRQRKAIQHLRAVVYLAHRILTSAMMVRAQRKFPPGGVMLKTGTASGNPVAGEFIVQRNAAGGVTFLKEPVTTWQFDYQIKGHEKTNP